MASKKEHKSKLRRLCPNCYYPLPTYGGFCSHCGQKYTDGKLTIWNLIREFFAGILNLESRIWQTLLALFIPGKLTKSFFKGRQQRYVSPLRLFFVTAIAFFAVLSIWGDDFAKNTVGTQIRKAEKDNYFASFMEELQEESDSLKANLSHTPDAPYVLDSLYHQMHNNYRDSLELGVELSQLFTGKISVDDLNSTFVAKKDVANMDVDSIIHHYAADMHYIDRLILRQNIRFQKDGESYVGFLISKLIWMMLIMMPLLALVLKLLYIRHSYYYVEHLIFSFHTHAFIFVIAALLFILTGTVEPVPISETARVNLHLDFLVTLSAIAIPVYFYLALLRVYKQSKRKTFFKFLVLNFCYLILFLLASIFTFTLTALLF